MKYLPSSLWPFTCGDCKVRFPKGSPLFLDGSAKLCDSCGKNFGAERPGKPKDSGTKYFPDFEINWAELKPMLVAATDPTGTLKLTGWKSAANRARFRKEFQGSDFAGFTAGQVHKWLRFGYETDAIKGLAGISPPMRERKRARFVEDGDELHIDRVYAGEDRFMSIGERREVMAGVRLEIELDASASSSDMLFGYQAWIARAIYALETSGVDCEVSIFTLSQNLFQGQSRTCRQRVTVKKFGEIADFAGFSAMFSPAAFRGIMFSTFALHADRQNLSLRGYGSGVTTAWGVKYDKKTRAIVVSCNWTATDFPAMEMTRMLREAIQAMRDDVPN